MDWRRQRNPSEASAQEEDRSRGCTTYSALTAGGSFSADLGSQLGQSRCAAAAVASSPDGADAHADHEPVASCGSERRLTPDYDCQAGRHIIGMIAQR